MAQEPQGADDIKIIVYSKTKTREIIYKSHLNSFLDRGYRLASPQENARFLERQARAGDTAAQGAMASAAAKAMEGLEPSK